MKPVTVNKRTFKVKAILAAVLAGIMLILIVGYAFTKDMKPQKDLTSGVTKSTKDESTQPAGEENATEPAQTEPADENGEQPQTEPVTAEPTTAKRKAMIVDINDAENWALAIIGVNYPLPDKYSPNLSEAVDGSSVKLDSRVATHYREMYNAAKQAGCILTPYSGYHTYSLQESTYTRKLNYYISQGYSEEQAAAETQKKTLPAGCSEHNAGLCMDIVSASSDFVNTKEFQWLCDNAMNYGFVLRYPENKQEITGVNYQPWHWRFVGVEAAKEMAQNNQCLEEYLGIV
ncbi:MAG: M15 family metallopeptidase [Clostridia bacterium]|nr:M15 family metallopeptidase [Clostridia bacterium]